MIFDLPLKASSKLSLDTLLRPLDLPTQSSSSSSKFTPPSQVTDVELKCPDEWIRLGTKCYLPFNIHQSWPFALTTCQRYGSTLAKIQTGSENQFIANLLSKPGGKMGEIKEYWIGLTVEVLDDDELYIWSDGTPTSRYVGFWRQDQPNFLNGTCAMGRVERKDLEWRLETCNLLRRFVCERPACVQGSYFCSSGSCISESKKCNGFNDCDDGSDEQNCPSAFQPACRTYEKGESGQLSSPNYPNSYDPNLNCRYVLEGPVNSRIELTIEHFETEPDFDVLTVLDGGPAENSTTVIIFSVICNFEKFLYGASKVPKSGISGPRKESKVAPRFPRFPDEQILNQCDKLIFHCIKMCRKACRFT
ncbi:hypothetical protein B9Z55_015761 [Caenorhabditis nigoni]|uniref:C-type lectin domain-containing protein n=1 Tax=Caenorhabditis nigoni TaxID=1611254 RepID=A0A2G5UBK7_9PELO|nr:hypothetical protein B9Z55_015761 [Caenorhabditis nigoni]